LLALLLLSLLHAAALLVRLLVEHGKSLLSVDGHAVAGKGSSQAKEFSPRSKHLYSSANIGESR